MSDSTSAPTRQLFLVVSYYSDEQQAAWDHVPAESAEAAKARIEALRPDSVICDVLILDGLRAIADRMAVTSLMAAEYTLLELEGKLPAPETLRCACCGAYTKGRQWWNQDLGYGLCVDHVDFVSRRCSPDQNLERSYGVRGIHFDLPKGEGGAA